MCILYFKKSRYDAAGALQVAKHLIQLRGRARASPGKIYRPFWGTAPLQYVYKWSITQAMANWI